LVEIGYDRLVERASATVPAPPVQRSRGTLRISARADYAVRAAIELAVAHDAGRATKGDAIGRAQGIPVKFLENILAGLCQHGIVRSQRGADGGYWLARSPAEITVADVMRALEGPLASVRGQRPESLGYSGSAAPLQDVWIAVRAALRDVVEHVTLADLAAGSLPAGIEALVAGPEAWLTR
jgi:Rrf2 family protein